MVTEYLDYTIDLDGESSVISYRVPFVQGDKIAHTFRITLNRGGTAADLTGVSCGGAVLRSNNTQVGLSGTVSGNKVTIPIPSAAYVVAGRVTIIIRLTTTTEIRTLMVCTAIVENADSGSTVEASSTIEVVSNILSQAQSIKQSLDNNYSTFGSRLTLAEDTIRTHTGQISSISGVANTNQSNISNLQGRMSTAETKLATIEIATDQQIADLFGI